MTRTDLITLEHDLSLELRKRIGLGGYSAEADSLVYLTQVNLEIVQHIIQIEKDVAKIKRMLPLKHTR